MDYIYFIIQKFRNYISIMDQIELHSIVLQKRLTNPQFLSMILFMDKASFTRHEIFNFHSNCVWKTGNLHENLLLIGTYKISCRLRTQSYLQLLQNNFYTKELVKKKTIELDQLWKYIQNAFAAIFNMVVIFERVRQMETV